MIEIKCKKCVTVIGERDNGTVKFGGIIAQAPCQVMCSKCGTINDIPDVPILNPEPQPLQVEIVEPEKPKDKK